MKNIYGYLITDAFIKDIEEISDKHIENIGKEQIESFIKTDRFSRIYKWDYNRKYIWKNEDEKLICTLDNNEFFKIEEFGIYIAEDGDGVGYVEYGKIGDVTTFFEGFLTCYTNNDDLIMKTIYRLDWDDEEDECYRAVQSFIKEFEDDEDGEDFIDFQGNKSTSLDREIAELIGQTETETFQIGTYLDRPIFEINDKLYYLTDESGVCNTEYWWYLQEVGKKCYRYFNYEDED